MVSISDGNKQVSMNLRYRDFFVDFLACLIPGYIFFVIAVIIIFNTIYLYFKFIPYTYRIDYFITIDFLGDLKNIVYYPFWIHVSIFILSFMFGFFLFRQDPKTPDHISYLKNRHTIKGYSEWVISHDKGLSPKDVQFPYCNLSNYLKSRGFEYDENIINWSCDKKDESSIKYNRSKAYINKLKMRISFFFPEALSTIIKNEAHIRFSSSMWYGFFILIKMIYAALLILIIYENFLLFKGANLFSIILLNIINFLVCYYSCLKIWNAMNIPKIINKNYNKTEAVIDEKSFKISKIYRSYDMAPFISSIILTSSLYISVIMNIFSEKNLAYSLLISFCMLSIFSFFIFYAKQKIETSFHYQRVREILYVIEVANIAKVIKDDDIEQLFQRKIAQQPHTH